MTNLPLINLINSRIRYQVWPSLLIPSFFIYMYMNVSNMFPFQGGKAVKDEETLESLEVKDGGKLYFKDLGMHKT